MWGCVCLSVLYLITLTELYQHFTWKYTRHRLQNPLGIVATRTLNDCILWLTIMYFALITSRGSHCCMYTTDWPMFNAISKFTNFITNCQQTQNTLEFFELYRYGTIKKKSNINVTHKNNKESMLSAMLLS